MARFEQTDLSGIHGVSLLLAVAQFIAESIHPHPVVLYPAGLPSGGWSVLWGDGGDGYIRTGFQRAALRALLL